jgi:S1-C subfamily serine protease
MRRILSALVASSLVLVLTATAPGATVAQPAPVLTTPQLVHIVSGSIVRIEVEGATEQTVTTGEGADARYEKVAGYQVFFGTGFVIDDAGHVVTNNHVVHPDGVAWKGEPHLTVELPRDFNPRPASFPGKAEEAYSQVVVRNGRALIAAPTVIGADEAADLAVVQIPAGLLKPLKFAAPETVEVGEDVVAIGFALGLSGAPSVTKGIVSGVGRSLSEPGIEVGDLIQTDAAINHGNSGGPLLDMHGDVVGVNTYTLAGDDGQTQGMYLARSSRTAARYVKELITDGRLARASLGLGTRLLGLADARSRDLPEGVLVTDVEAGSAAEKAGLHEGDMILRVGGCEVHSVGDMYDALALVKPGQSVEVEFRDFQTNLNPPDETADIAAKLTWTFLSAVEKEAGPRTVKATVK